MECSLRSCNIPTLKRLNIHHLSTSIIKETVQKKRPCKLCSSRRRTPKPYPVLCISRRRSKHFFLHTTKPWLTQPLSLIVVRSTHSPHWLDKLHWYKHILWSGIYARSGNKTNPDAYKNFWRRPTHNAKQEATQQKCAKISLLNSTGFLRSEATSVGFGGLRKVGNVFELKNALLP